MTNGNDSQLGATGPTNQPQDEKDSWLPENIVQIQLHANKVAQMGGNYQQEKENLNTTRNFIKSPQSATYSGTKELEKKMTDLDMPGISDRNTAIKHIDTREEAILENQALKNQGKSYANLPNEEKKKAEARIYHGMNQRRAWGSLYQFGKINDTPFTTTPTTPASKALSRGLQETIENELKIIAARNKNKGFNYQDKEKINEIATKMVMDPDFVNKLNNQDWPYPNTTILKEEISKRAQKYDA